MDTIMLYISLSSWIIQDGNYDDFRIGETRKFGLEFYPEDLKLSDNQNISFSHLEGSRYKICSRLIFLGTGCAVIDFGVRAYYQFDQAEFDFKVGDYLMGVIALGVDPFMYFESLNKIPEMPEIIYSWSINEIEIETAPFIEHKSDGEFKYLARDPSKLSLKNIERTDAWNDDNGSGEYILTCSLLNIKTFRDLQ